MIVLGTYFDGAHFARTPDRIAKLVAHDIYQYGRGDVEVLTDNEFLDRYGKDSLEMKEGERVNLVLIGAGHQNSATHLVLGERDSEGSSLYFEHLLTLNLSYGYPLHRLTLYLIHGAHVVTIDTEKGTVSIHPTDQDFHQPGTGLLMIRPWGPSNLAMVIAGLDLQEIGRASCRERVL